jgi:hypothetical protein
MVDFSKLQEKYEQLTKVPGATTGKNDFLAQFMQLQMDTNVVRILPWRDESKEFYAETSIHRVPMSKHDLDGQARNIHCIKLIGQKCPACDFYFNLWKTGKPEDEAIARKLRARERYYMNVLNRETNEVKILSVGKKLFSSIVAAMMDSDYGDITNVKTGHDFKIVKEMSGEYPNYDKSAPRPKPEPLGTDAEIAEIMDQLHDVHNLVKHQEYSDIKNTIDEFYNGPQLMREMPAPIVPFDEFSLEEKTTTSEPLTDTEYLDRLREST